MNPQLFSNGRAARALNMVDSSLTTLKQKGNLSYVNEIYNSNNFFEEVHHISFYLEDSEIELENKTIKVHVLRRVVNRPLWHPANVLFFLLQIIKTTRKNRVSVIRGRSVGLAGFIGLLTGKILRIPFVVSLGGNNRLSRELIIRFGKKRPTRMKMLKKVFADLVEIFIVRNADYVIVPNTYTQNYVVSLKTDRKKTAVISWILKKDVLEGKVDRDKLKRLMKRFGLDPNKPIVPYVGRLEPDKQVDVLIEAIPFVLEKKADAQFVLIGDGSLRESLESRVQSLGVVDNVFFLGFQPIKVIKALLSVASVVCIPMSGFVVFEAAAVSAPIVTFDVEWHHEFISNEINGILVENRNYEKMAEAVVRILDKPALGRKYGEEARHKLMTEYNPNIVKKKEGKFYEAILSKP